MQRLRAQLLPQGQAITGKTKDDRIDRVLLGYLTGQIFHAARPGVCHVPVTKPLHTCRHSGLGTSQADGQEVCQGDHHVRTEAYSIVHRDCCTFG